MFVSPDTGQISEVLQNGMFEASRSALAVVFSYSIFIAHFVRSSTQRGPWLPSDLLFQVCVMNSLSKLLAATAAVAAAFPAQSTISIERRSTPSV